MRKHDKTLGGTRSPLYAALRILDKPPNPPPNQLRTHLIDNTFLNQKTYKYIRILDLLKCKRSKKEISL